MRRRHYLDRLAAHGPGDLSTVDHDRMRERRMNRDAAGGRERLQGREVVAEARVAGRVRRRRGMRRRVGWRGGRPGHGDPEAAHARMLESCRRAAARETADR